MVSAGPAIVVVAGIVGIDEDRTSPEQIAVPFERQVDLRIAGVLALVGVLEAAEAPLASGGMAVRSRRMRMARWLALGAAGSNQGRLTFP